MLSTFTPEYPSFGGCHHLIQRVISPETGKKPLSYFQCFSDFPNVCKKHSGRLVVEFVFVDVLSAIFVQYLSAIFLAVHCPEETLLMQELSFQRCRPTQVLWWFDKYCDVRTILELTRLQRRIIAVCSMESVQQQLSPSDSSNNVRIWSLIYFG